MALLGFTSQSGRFFNTDDPAMDPRLHLRSALEKVPEGAPVVIMIHGYKYHPRRAYSDPHRLLFAPVPEKTARKFSSWSTGLGFALHTVDDGLGIGFGWEGLPSHKIKPTPRLSGFAHVYGQAYRAGGHLARLLSWIEKISPGRKVDILAHSLGARVAFIGLMRGASSNARRVILLSGAEYASNINRYFRHVDRHPSLEVFSIQNNRNGFVDFLFECFAPRPHPQDKAMGRNFQGPPERWLTLAIDDPATRSVLAERGIGIERPLKRHRVDHWGLYTRAGTMRFYQDLLRAPEKWRIGDLHHSIAFARKVRSISANKPIVHSV